MDRKVIYPVSFLRTTMGWLMVICLSAVLAFGTYGLVRWTQAAREQARKARLAALDERMRKGYRLKIRSAPSTLPPRPSSKPPKRKS